jgi:protein required for attachment to host cells
MNNWILIANKTKAKVFNISKTVGALESITSIENVDAHLNESDLVSDKQGIGVNSASPSGGATLSRESSAVEESLNRYAKIVVKYLSDGKNGKKFDNLVVVAEPGMLGIFKQLLEKNNLKIAKTINKDLMHSSDNQLNERLIEELMAVFPPG